MRGILIKDMEMPENCAVCDWGSYVGNGRAMCSKTSMTEKTDIMSNRRPDWCPLIEISSHVKLIEWTPCSERLPEVKQKVLVQYTDGSMATKRCNDAGHLQWFYANAVAWMPAPEPWKGDAE